MSDQADRKSKPRTAKPPARVTRHVQPLGPRVLVRIDTEGDRLDSGLYVPQGAKENKAEALLGEVVEVARAMPKSYDKSYDEYSRNADDDDDRDDDDDSPGDFGANVSGVPLGAKVLFGKDRGTQVPWDDTLRVIDVRYILAIVDEITQEQMQ